MRVVVVTGLSGGGKSTALRALEDMDYYCADNLPLPLVEPLLELLAGQQGRDKVALGIDARQGPMLASFRDVVARLRRQHQVEVLFLDADDDLLVRRYSETRRRHPLAGDDLRAGIAAERQILRPLRESAEAFVDTTALNVHQLKGVMQERYGRAEGGLSATILSFGFKHGLPAEADVVIDVRFMPNPYFVEALSALSGNDETVAKFVLDSPDAREFMDRTTDYLAYALPRYEREGKAYLTIAVGCTGGRHRSVAVANELARRLGGDGKAGAGKVTVRHRDLERGGAP